MKPELEQQLIEKYPFLSRDIDDKDENGRINNLYVAFGFETGSGWFSLIDSLCGEIVAVYEKHGIPIDVRPAQIKEKFGGLRFYWCRENQEKSVHAIDFLGNGTIRFQQDDSDLDKEIGEVVDKWEDISYTVCERCGQPGELRKDLRWIRVLCSDCYNKYLSKQNR